MKPEKMDISDLLANESFINYCKKSSPGDVAFWEEYLEKHPDRKPLVEQAKDAFTELFNALAAADREEQVARLKNRLNLVEPTRIVQMEVPEKKKAGIKLSVLLKLTAAAAMLVLAVFTIFKFYNIGGRKGNKTFVAAYGERKNIQLPDGSDVTLNAGSKIEIHDDLLALPGMFILKVKHF